MDRRATALLLLTVGLSLWAVIVPMLPNTSTFTVAAHFVSGLLTGVGITMLLRDCYAQGSRGA